jgi:hypothetical protein
LDKSLKFCTKKKTDSAAIAIFCSKLDSDSDLVSYDIWPS